MNTIFFLTIPILLLTFASCIEHKPTASIVKTNPYEGKDISAYLIGEYMDEQSVQSKLQQAGFEVVARCSPVKRGITIIFTDDTLKQEGARTGRSNAAILRIFIDDKMHKISITNPIYFGKAFMQDDFDYKVFTKELMRILKAFPNLQPSKDKMQYEELAEYNFMIGMPGYEQVDIFAKEENSALLMKLQNYENGKNIVFTLKLSKETTLVGYDLGDQTNKFVKKIGRLNAVMLPWTITVENSQATALNPKYYIAVSYPLLSMRDFMRIATLPSTITKELSKPFK